VELLENSLLRWKSWHIDRILLQLDARGVRLQEDFRDALTSLRDELEELADDARMERTLRKLDDLDDNPTLTYRPLEGDEKQENKDQLKPEGNYKYKVSLAKMTESLRFTIVAGDAKIDEKRIRLMPPPVLAKLSAITEEPAYLIVRVDENRTDQLAQL